MSLAYTPCEQIPDIVKGLRETFNKGKTRPLEFRKQQLNQLFKLMTENEQQLLDALKKDIRKPALEALIADIGMARNEAAHMIDHLEEYAKPQKPSVELVNKADNCQIWYEPLGVVLIIGTWNYPIQVSLTPLAGAIAAGNCAVLKLSEIAVNVAQVLTDLFPKYLDQSCYKIVNGSVNETTTLLNQRYDHIFYTGSGNIGKIIMSAAAKHLCSVTLELGGKSPVVVDDNSDLENVARRVAWGRWINAGQTCIAPDYIICTKSTQDKLIPLIRKSIEEYYGKDPKESKDYCRIVSQGHFKRLCNAIDTSKGEVVIGGQRDESDLYIAPTVVANPTLDSQLMREEIFGPVLPIVNVNNIQEAIDFINEREKPLALYVFSRSDSVIQKVLKNTSSGGAVANDCNVHATVPQLPFGGVGGSGMGAYHGKSTFECFSHKRAEIGRAHV